MHGDPIQGIDPTGQFLGALAFANVIGVANSIITLTEGLLLGSVLQFGTETAQALDSAGFAAFNAGEFDLAFDFFARKSTVMGKFAK